MAFWKFEWFQVFAKDPVNSSEKFHTFKYDSIEEENFD